MSVLLDGGSFKNDMVEGRLSIAFSSKLNLVLSLANIGLDGIVRSPSASISNLRLVVSPMGNTVRFGTVGPPLLGTCSATYHQLPYQLLRGKTNNNNTESKNNHDKRRMKKKKEKLSWLKRISSSAVIQALMLATVVRVRVSKKKSRKKK